MDQPAAPIDKVGQMSASVAKIEGNTEQPAPVEHVEEHSSAAENVVEASQHLDTVGNLVEKALQHLAAVEDLHEVASQHLAVAENIVEASQQSTSAENIVEASQQSTSAENINAIREQSSSTENGGDAGQQAMSSENMEDEEEIWRRKCASPSTSGVNEDVDLESGVIEPTENADYQRPRRVLNIRPITRNDLMPCIVMAVAVVISIAGMVYVRRVVLSNNYTDLRDNLLIALGIILFAAVYYVFVTYYGNFTLCLKWFFCPPKPRCVPTAGERMQYRNSLRTGGQRDIENQVASPDAIDEQGFGPPIHSIDQTKGGKDGNSSTAEEKELILQQPPHEVCTVSTTSEIASATSRIVPETVAGEGGSQAKGTVQSLASSQEQNEGLSSGELRRRKFPNTEESKDLTASSDEEFAKKE